MEDFDYYDRIIYVKGGRYSFARIGKPALVKAGKRKKIIDALEDKDVKTVSPHNSYWYEIKITYHDGRIKYL